MTESKTASKAEQSRPRGATATAATPHAAKTESRPHGAAESKPCAKAEPRPKAPSAAPPDNSRPKTPPDAASSASRTDSEPNPSFHPSAVPARPKTAAAAPLAEASRAISPTRTQTPAIISSPTKQPRIEVNRAVDKVRSRLVNSKNSVLDAELWPNTKLKEGRGKNGGSGHKKSDESSNNVAAAASAAGTDSPGATAQTGNGAPRRDPGQKTHKRRGSLNIVAYSSDRLHQRRGSLNAEATSSHNSHQRRRSLNAETTSKSSTDEEAAPERQSPRKSKKSSFGVEASHKHSSQHHKHDDANNNRSKSSLEDGSSLKKSKKKLKKKRKEDLNGSKELNVSKDLAITTDDDVAPPEAPLSPTKKGKSRKSSAQKMRASASASNSGEEQSNKSPSKPRSFFRKQSKPVASAAETTSAVEKADVDNDVSEGSMDLLAGGGSMDLRAYGSQESLRGSQGSVLAGGNHNASIESLQSSQNSKSQHEYAEDLVDSKSRFQESRNFFEGGEAHLSDRSGDEKSSHKRRGSLNDSAGGDSKSRFAVSASLFEKNHGATQDDFSEGSFDVLGPNAQSAAPDKDDASFHHSMSASASRLQDDPGLVDSKHRFQATRDYFADKALESSDTSLILEPGAAWRKPQEQRADAASLQMSGGESVGHSFASDGGVSDDQNECSSPDLGQSMGNLFDPAELVDKSEATADKKHQVGDFELELSDQSIQVESSDESDNEGHHVPAPLHAKPAKSALASGGKPKIEKKARVRFCFEGRPKASNPDRAPRPPANVSQVPLEVKMDYKPREYKKSEEEEEQITRALSSVFAFESMSSNSMKTLIAAFEPEEAEAGVEIVGPDKEDDNFYVVADGEVRVDCEGDELDILTSGEHFGETNLFHKPPNKRRLSYSAVSRTQLFKVDQATYRSVLQTETRTVEKRKKELADKLPLFESMSQESRNKVASVMQSVSFGKGEKIPIGSGADNRLYVVDKGSVRCMDSSEAGDNGRIVKSGAHFGGEAFFKPTYIESHVEAVAETNVSTFFIDVSTYEQAVGPVNERIMPDVHSTRFKELKPSVHVFEGFRFNKKKPLTLTEMRAVVSLMEDRIYEKGDIIVEAGKELPARAYILRKGMAEARTGPANVSWIVAGTLFGDSLFNSALSTGENVGICVETVTAAEKCIVSVVRIEDFLSTKDLYLKKGNHQRYQPADYSDSDSTDSESDVSDYEEEDVAGKFATKGHVFKLENLVKETILGEGGFGQVWMVYDQTEPKPKPYAFKIQSKYELTKTANAEVAVREKNILSKLNHPGVISLLAAYQDESFIYFLLNMMRGGELYSLMHPLDEDLSTNGFPESQAKFYAFALADALAYIHSKGIVYRDLKPENVLIDDRGYPVLVDFGLAKELKDGEKTFTLRGTPGYLPPEVVLSMGHTFSADHWSLGVLIHEMFDGDGPFFYFGIDQVDLYRSIVQDPHDPPENASPEACDFIDHLLVKDPVRRLGSLAGGEADILNNVWFEDMDLGALRKGKIKAPWVPEIEDSFDTSNFEDWSELEDRSKEVYPRLTEEEAAVFDGF